MEEAQDILNSLKEFEKERKEVKRELPNIKITKEQVNLMKLKEDTEKKENEKKEREESRILEKKLKKEKLDKYNKSSKKKIKNFFKKIKNKKITDDDDKNFLKKFIAYFLVNGGFLSVSIFSLIKFFTNFNWFSIIYGIFGFGIILWYIENNLVEFIKNIKRRESE